jgi:phosphoglycolate phosphatase-like HAD superfamily hydrolase
MRHLLVFDVDGTLTRTMAADTRCYAQALFERLRTPIDTDWASYRFVTDPGIAAEAFERCLGRPPAPHELDAVRARFLALLAAQDGYDEVPGAAALLQRLRLRRDVFLAIATGAWSDSALLKLRRAGIAVDGLPMATGDDASAREEILRLAILRAGRPFDRVTYVGDGVWDVAATRALGIGFVGISCDGDATALRAAGAVHVLPDLRDADRLLAAAGVADPGGPRE